MPYIPLSEAIRRGAKMAPKGKYLMKNGFGHTCAIGAACEAVGVEPKLSWPECGDATYPPALRLMFPILDAKVVECDVVVTLASSIMFWNDIYDLSREEIADRVELIELHNQDCCTATPPTDMHAKLTQQVKEAGL